MNEDSHANGFCKASIDGNSNRGNARARAESGAGETRLRAYNPERPRQEHGCRHRELSSRRQIAGPSSCSVGVHLRLRVVTIRSQVGDEPATVYRVGEGFYEVPGSHHRISENASDKEPASLLAVFVVDTNDNPLTTPDQK